MNTRLSPSQDHLPLEREARAHKKEDCLSDSHPLSHYRGVRAWVLLADPGAGKSDVFTTLGLMENGTCIRARDFMEVGAPTNWHEPLFIDGLDEISASSSLGITPLGLIRQKLHQLGTPKFRISCREADWRGNADGDALKRLVGDDNFAELHLTPLSHAQSVGLIAHWRPCTKAQAEAFMQEAGKRDLEGLLDNPQTLHMLVKAHATNGGDWPASKTQTYEMACAQLVREHNDEHLANTRDSTPPDDQTLLAAGYLSAVMLLSASGSIALQRQTQPRSGVVTLPELNNTNPAPDLPACRVALHTRLFRGTGHGGEFVPVHRTVAEYLGAHYLATRINAGLPVNRVLALVLGQDGGLVPELRGLHAWLAAVAPANLRRELIAHHPLGVVINGDIRAFSRDDKLNVLNALQHEATQDASFRRGNWASHPFGALATPDMEDDFRAPLQSPDRSPAHQALLGCVLDALAHGMPMPALTSVLEQVVRDKTYWSHLRTAALRILVAYSSNDGNWMILTTLLADVHVNAVEDMEDELLGTLLQTLYPVHVTPAKLWSYFKKPKKENFLGAYKRFWRELGNGKKLNPGDVPILLDALHASNFHLIDRASHWGISKVVGELLACGVTQYGTQIETQRLDNWLALGNGLGHHPVELEHKNTIRQWLGENPAVYKALFEYGLTASIKDRNTRFGKLSRIRLQLYGAPAPDDAQQWFLSLAEACGDEDLRHQLLREAFDATEHKTGADAAVSLLEQWSVGHTADTDWVQGQLSCHYPPPAEKQEYIDSEARSEALRNEEHLQQVSLFRQTLPSFETSLAHLGALSEIGNHYLNYFGESNQQTANDRLLELLNQDREWVKLALKGLRQCLFRDDLPSCTEIIDLNLKGSLYNLALPCLAAMELRYTEDPLTALDLAPTILETLAAFFLTSHTSEGSTWFKPLLAQRPDVLTSVMLRLINKQIAAKKEHADGVYALACDPDYALVARLITPALATAFPAKAAKKQLHNLRMLLVSAWANLDKDAQLSLISNKLGAQGMDVAQQTYWLTLGALLAPDLYLARTRQFVEKSQIRTQHAFALLYELRERGGLQANLTVQTQSFLIGLLGPHSNPGWLIGSGYVTTEMNMGEYVAGLMSNLAGNPDDAAAQALTDFQQRHDMKQWHDPLNRALYDQHIARRKALFKPATVKQVSNTLANLQPASAADLWALTTDHLTHLIRQIRDSDKDIYDQYWDGDTPKSEERCRNALLTALEPRLSPLAITVIPERQLADKKRADIGIASGLIHIPLEAKGEWNPDLWKAIDKQLIAQYCREPACDGYGIYLVFWFNSDRKKPGATDGGSPPKTPQELQQRLKATVPNSHKHKIAVLVVDCSKPHPTKSI